MCCVVCCVLCVVCVVCVVCVICVVVSVPVKEDVSVRLFAPHHITSHHTTPRRNVDRVVAVYVARSLAPCTPVSVRRTLAVFPVRDPLAVRVAVGGGFPVAESRSSADMVAVSSRVADVVGVGDELGKEREREGP